MLILPKHYDTRMKPPLGSVLDTKDPINTGLAARWLFNEGGGSVVRDLAGTNHGVFGGDPEWLTGPRGPYVNCDGTGDWIDCGDVKALDGKNQISLSLWMRGTTDSSYIASKYGGASASSFHVLTYKNTIYAYVGNEAGTTGEAHGTDYTESVIDGAWHHIVMTYDGQTVRVYIDGRLGVGSSSLTGNIYNNTYPLRLGGLTYYDVGCTGGLDNGSLYTHALSPAEIRRLYLDPWAGIQRSPIELHSPVMVPAVAGITVSPDALSLTLTLPAPDTKYDFQVSPATLAMLIAAQTPSEKYDFKVSPDALALLLGLSAPTTNYDVKFSSDVLALILASPAPIATYDFKVAPDAQGLIASLQSASVNYDFKLSIDALALVLNGPAPTTTYDYKIALDSALALAASLQNPDISTGLSITVTPSAQGLVVSIQTPTLTYDYLLAIATSMGMTCTLQVPDVSTGAGRTYIVCSSTDPAMLDIYVGGIMIARFS